MLLTRSGSSKLAQEQMLEWLMSQFNAGEIDVKDAETGKTRKQKVFADWSKIVMELITATGVTNDNGAVNFILHHLGDAIAQDARANGKFDMVPVTSRTTKLFLGLRTQCVQCHDHPFNGEWEQKHFWGINAFFRSSDAPRGRPQGMMPQKKGKGIKEAQRELVDRNDLNSDGKVQYERRNATIYYTKATFLDGKRLPEEALGSRRQQLAKFVTDSPYFGKVFVNRMWHHFFGKSFTKDAPDDFGEHNPASHPELLDRLAEEGLDVARVGGQVRLEDLDGHQPVHAELAGLEDRAHRAAPEALKQLVAGDPERLPDLVDLVVDRPLVVGGEVAALEEDLADRLRHEPELAHLLLQRLPLVLLGGRDEAAAVRGPQEEDVVFRETLQGGHVGWPSPAERR